MELWSQDRLFALQSYSHKYYFPFLVHTFMLLKHNDGMLVWIMHYELSSIIFQLYIWWLDFIIFQLYAIIQWHNIVHSKWSSLRGMYYPLPSSLYKRGFMSHLELCPDACLAAFIQCAHIKTCSAKPISTPDDGKLGWNIGVCVYIYIFTIKIWGKSCT